MDSEIGLDIGRRGVLVLHEISAVLARVDPAQLEALETLLLRSRRVFLSAQGRSGLVLRAVGVRLMHIGLTVYAAGEIATPAIGEGDVLVAVSSSAKTPTTLDHLAVARRNHAVTVLVTTASVAAPSLADHLLVVPARTTVRSEQHAGSLFEQAVLILGDCLAWHLQTARAVAEAALNARHANLQ